MPTYDYECRSCGFSEETFQKFSDKPLTKCPECGLEEYRRVILQAPNAFVKGDPTTVQHLADRNTQKMGNYELQDKMKADNMDKHIKDKEVNRFRNKINKMTAQEKKRYIEKGDNV